MHNFCFYIHLFFVDSFSVGRGDVRVCFWGMKVLSFFAESFVVELQAKDPFLLFFVLIYGFLWSYQFFCGEWFWTGFCTELEICLLPSPVSYCDLVAYNLMSMLHSRRFGVFLFVMNLWSFLLVVLSDFFFLVLLKIIFSRYFILIYFSYITLYVPSVLTFNDFNWSLYSEHSAVIVLGSMSIIFVAEYFRHWIFGNISYWSCSPGVYPTLYLKLNFMSY